ncbi:MAG: TIGR02688 family protein [Acidobacteria bacterium RIFCSPLOWO2_12_FULL_54_10]|nr:MAG: TIGR02688 family protein [Acidobacteria bacterium RIFCSPLOWO2_12_FULL_54_10]
MSQQLDHLDTISTKAFEGYVVRKDLVRKFKGQYPVPTYVAEFLLGRYCASVDDDEIAEGLKIVERQLGEKTVRAGEHELFKARAKDKGQVKLIDIITARLDAGSDSFLATLPSLQLKDVRISEAMVHANERMLTGGFYAEVELAYDPTIAQEKNGRPFGIESMREIQLSKREVLPALYQGREAFATEEWRDFLIRSIGMEPEQLPPRARDMMILRMVPFVERNYNMVELGPRGTGKSHLFQQVSPYAHLISGGKATVARMFVNNANGQRGLVCQYDVVCFDEISGVSFDQKDGVNIMKGYMESGEFSRGKESIRADGGVVMVGNFDVDVQHQQRVGHLFGPLPPEMRSDTAFMDRIHAYLPGWDLPKVSRDLLTNHFGLVSDFLSECWNQLRRQSRQNLFQGRIHLGGALSGRDTTGVQKTVSGLIKLMSPNIDTPVPDELLEWALRIALECRRRVKEQQKRIGSAEFRNTHFSYSMGEDGVEKFVATPELYSENSIGSDPLPPGQAWVIAPGGGDENPGLYRVDITEGPGSGVKILNQPAPPPFKESVRCAEQNLYVRSKELVGDRDPRQHEFSVQLRAFDIAKSGSAVGVGVLLALCSSLLQKSIKGGLAVTGGLNLGGSIETIFNPVAVVEIAIEKGADSILMPISSRRQLNDLPDDLAAKITIHYYLDARDALLKALAV